MNKIKRNEISPAQKHDLDVTLPVFPPQKRSHVTITAVLLTVTFRAGPRSPLSEANSRTRISSRRPLGESIRWQLGCHGRCYGRCHFFAMKMLGWISSGYVEIYGSDIWFVYR